MSAQPHEYPSDAPASGGLPHPEPEYPHQEQLNNLSGPANLEVVSTQPEESSIEDETDLYAAYEAEVPVTDPIRQYFKEIGKISLLSAEQEVVLSKRIEAGLYASQLLLLLAESRTSDADDSQAPDMRTTPPDVAELNMKMEEDLALLAADGEQAMRDMTEANLRLVVSVAKRYQNKGLDLLELIQEGNLGLMHAIEKFDYTKGFKFSTYATWWLKQTMVRAIAKSGRSIRLPAHAHEIVTKIGRFRAQYLGEHGEYPAPHITAGNLGMTEEKVKEYMELGQDTISLQAPIGNGPDASELQYFIADNGSIDAFEMAAAEDLRNQLLKALDTLSDRDAMIMKLRFGLTGEQPMSLEAVGKIFGLTRGRVQQIERDSRIKLKNADAAQGLRQFLSAN